MRVAFLSDFHTGSHTNDVARLHALMEEVCAHHPDVVLFGGDYVNLQWIGGGRVPPYTIAAALGRAHAPLGRFAILGNHDCSYDASAVARALSAHGIRVLDHECRSIEFENAKINILGIPDEYRGEPKAFWLLKSMRQEVTIVLAHDPAWFRYLPSGPFIMLAGHAHGGQIR